MLPRGVDIKTICYAPKPSYLKRLSAVMGVGSDRESGHRVRQETKPDFPYLERKKAIIYFLGASRPEVKI